MSQGKKTARPLHCLVCNHDWMTSAAKRPARCPNCNELGWDMGKPPDLGEVLNETVVEIQVTELRHVISLLEARIAELLARKESK